MRDAGIAYAVDQIVDLIAHGVDGIHLYTMNNPYVARKITEAVSSLFMITLDRLNRKEAIRYLGGAGISLNYRMDVLMDECEKRNIENSRAEISLC